MASEMVGEILKLSIAVTLVAVFSISVYSLLPDERIPYMEIELSSDINNSSIIHLTHVGGDSLRVSEISLEITNSSNISQTNYTKLSTLTSQPYWRFPETVDINITKLLNTNPEGVTVTVIHTRGILAEGVIST
ncbi:type IV pilin N-terminal domain-containing protein [Methanolobus vulcani]|uniref:Type IV pilin n=1 Tax=Methanolobus vulcani TaxID=38026 RepID=A0A7Z8KR70_9EURY|nr:type IV pilin N-terminal domain-containing protein [Methanolobus vulcani]TQD29537.1 type IV pilin [Methanolobus vulcani]